MPNIRSTLIGLIAAASLAAPAFAQQIPNPLTYQTGFTNPYPFPLTASLPNGDVMQALNGKADIATDATMSDGNAKVDWFQVLGTYRHEN